jgi:hypothetical protein
MGQKTNGIVDTLSNEDLQCRKGVGRGICIGRRWLGLLRALWQETLGSVGTERLPQATGVHTMCVQTLPFCVQQQAVGKSSPNTTQKMIDDLVVQSKVTHLAL